MSSHTIHLGYEVGSGEPVQIPVRHMVVTGQTQESGKTTTLEALVHRSGLPAIAFLTKRGEASLSGRQILPFFRERADWQFVQSLLESTMKERMKFERAWIVRACQGARSLADVAANVDKLQGKAKNSLSQDIYMLLGEYLRKVVPLVRQLPKCDHVDVASRAWDGAHGDLAIMDLVAYPEELQMLVVASTLEWIHKHANGLITIIPEAWKFIPESKNTPVKVVAEKLAREGAGLKNFIWIDSQDIAGVWKLVLRGCAVWLLGVQREANEVKRAIANMPEGMKRPKAGDVAQLELGQFFCCHGRELRKVYVQPAWMESDMAQEHARGELDLTDYPATLAAAKKQGRPESAAQQPDTIFAAQASAIEEDEMRRQYTEEELFKAACPNGSGNEEVIRGVIRVLLPVLNGDPQTAPPATAQPDVIHSLLPMNPPESVDIGAWVPIIVAHAIERIRKDPMLIKLSQERPVIELAVRKKVLPLEDSTLKGKVASLIHSGFFQSPRSFKDVKAELTRRGLDPKTPNLRIADPLKEFTELGFFFRNGEAYELAPDIDVRVVNA